MIHAALAFVLLAGLPADTTLVPGNQEAINVTAAPVQQVAATEQVAVTPVRWYGYYGPGRYWYPGRYYYRPYSYGYYPRRNYYDYYDYGPYTGYNYPYPYGSYYRGPRAFYYGF